MEDFFTEYGPQLAPFLLFGSGDFHHLTALCLRRIDEPIVVVSFDNHPDWDVRPPKWACGAWVNRALELPQVRRVSIWGCGNFECWWPAQIFGNRRAERECRIEVHPWADDRSSREQNRRGAILRSNWREKFERFVGHLNGAAVYVTVDLDCLLSGEAVTNWENGRFTADEVVWAIGRLHQTTRILAGDICGPFSTPKYARRTQQLAAEWDHPKMTRANASGVRDVNFASLVRLWPALTDGDQHNSSSDQN